MKKRYVFFIGVIFLFGCYEHMPPFIAAQNKAEHYLDSLYRPDTIGVKIGMGSITIKDYAAPVKRSEFQQNIDLSEIRTINWSDFTRKTNDIVVKRKGDAKGSTVILKYQVRHTEHITAFFVGSPLREVFDKIQFK